jgi:ATP-dependent DNA helicase DinG
MAAAEVLTLSSPFDHARQMRIRVAAGMPPPDNPRYAERLPQALLEAIELTGGRALVLFTNTATMRSAAQALATPLEARGIPLLVQGEEMEKHALLEEFRKTTASVLFGLDSFWMGVDVPGEALSHVVITKLPFAVPNNPMVEARTDLITARGGNPFSDYSLPEAILKFRQGVGRLIRTSNDRGIVTILDSRIARKAYGRMFLNALPSCPVEIIGQEGDMREEIPDLW